MLYALILTPWGVRAVLKAFILACELYQKHRERCEHYLSPAICATLSAVCYIVASLDQALDELPRVGTRS